MEETGVALNQKQKDGKKLNLTRTIFTVLLVLTSLLLGFYTGSRYGLDVATNDRIGILGI